MLSLDDYSRAVTKQHIRADFCKEWEEYAAMHEPRLAWKHLNSPNMIKTLDAYMKSMGGRTAKLWSWDALTCAEICTGVSVWRLEHYFSHRSPVMLQTRRLGKMSDARQSVWLVLIRETSRMKSTGQWRCNRLVIWRQTVTFVLLKTRLHCGRLSCMCNVAGSFSFSPTAENKDTGCNRAIAVFQVDSAELLLCQDSHTRLQIWWSLSIFSALVASCHSINKLILSIACDSSYRVNDMRSTFSQETSLEDCLDQAAWSWVVLERLVENSSLCIFETLCRIDCKFHNSWMSFPC